MANINETHPFLVSVWIAGNGNSKSLLEKGYWMEEARCKSKQRAEEVAVCLSLRHPKGVQVAELVNDEKGGQRWQGYQYIPESARELMRGEQKPFDPTLAIARYRELEALLNLELLKREDWQQKRAQGDTSFLLDSPLFAEQNRIMEEADRAGYWIVDAEDENGNPIYGIEPKEDE